VGYFQVVAVRSGPGADIILDGRWHACETCRRILQRRMWLTLANRCVESHARILQQPAASVRPELVAKLIEVSKVWTGEYHEV
jgi:hypothetical protein